MNIIRRVNAGLCGKDLRLGFFAVMVIMGRG